MSEPHYLTIGDVARRYGCQAWQVRRLFQRGLLPPAVRLGGYRVIAATELASVEKALSEAGYLPGKKEVAVAAS